MLNKEHIKLLIDALRSGQYAQGRGRLRKGLEFCCLGVGCDISSLGEWQTTGWNYYAYQCSPDDLNGPFPHKYRSESYWPIPVQQFFGVTAYSGGLFLLPAHLAKKHDIIHLHASLSQMNDVGMTFEEIAEVLELAIARPVVFECKVEGPQE